MQCRFGSHGDYTVIALCPASVQEMYELTAKAFNLADQYRVPVFLMADEIVGPHAGEDHRPGCGGERPAKGTRQGALPFQRRMAI